MSSKSGHSHQGQRQLRVAEQVRQALCEVLQHAFFNDPALQDIRLVTVSEIKISPDLKNATAYVMPSGGSAEMHVIEAMNRARSYFRTEVAHRLNLRNTPRMKFELDVSFENAHHINALLESDRVARDLENINDTNTTEDE